MTFSVKRLFNLIRGTLLAITLLGGVVALFWIYGPQQIDRLDHWVVSRYMAGYQERLREARSQAGKVPDQAIGQLEGLLSDLEEVEKADRLGRIKRQALFLLVQLLEKRGDVARALVWTRRWVAFDPHDLNARYREAMLLYQTPSSREQGMAAMARLYRMMPEVARVAMGYARLLYEAGQGEQAAVVMNRYRELRREQGGAPLPLAEVFLDHGRGFSAATRIRVYPVTLDQGRSGLFFTAPAGVRRLRIDPLQTLVAPRLFIWWGDTGRSIDLARETLRFHEMSRVGKDRLGVDGEDPYLVWRLPEPLSRQPLALLLVAREDIRPAWMLQGMPGGKGMRSSTPAAAGEEPLPDLQGARRYLLQALQNYPMELFWRNGKATFSPRRKLRERPRLEQDGTGGRLEVRFTLPEATEASALRVDLAAIPGVAYRPEALRLETASGTRPIAPSGMKTNQLQSVDGWLRPDGNDPYLLYPVPPGVGEIRSVVFRSLVR